MGRRVAHKIFSMTRSTHVLQVSSASVDLIISVLQYDNPSGTSYTGMNSTSDRKCCDAGTGSAGCGIHGDTCDVLFAFCLGM